MRLRYFFWFVIAFLSGILCAAMGWRILTVISLAVLVLLGLLFRSYRKVFLMAVLGTVVGFFFFSAQSIPYLQKLSSLDGHTVTATGRIEGIWETDRLRLLVFGDLAGKDFRYEDVRFYLYPEGENNYTYGDLLSFEAKAYTPGEPNNFGESDYRIYCMEQGIYASFYPKTEEITRCGHSLSLFRPKDFTHVLRAKAQNTLSGRVSPATEGFLRAFLIGDKSLLFAESRSDLQRAGLSHIVAVSGLHLQIVCGAVMALFGIMKIRRRLFSNIFYLLLVWFFVLFTGASPSVLRAALMLSVFFFADFFRRERDSLTALAFSAFALCLSNPAILFNIGFQLSFSSTFGILLFAKPFSDFFAFLPRFFHASLSVTLSAMVGFAPLAAYHFGAVSIVGILANLLVCPLLTVLMLAGLCALLLAPIPYVSSVLFFFLDKAVHYILWVARFLGNTPFATVHFRRPGTLEFLLYIGLTVAFLALKNKRFRIYFLCLALFLSTLQSAQQLFLRENTVTITFLSVGKSHCTLVQTDGKTLLFDSGESTGSHISENTVIPYLFREGIFSIDGAFLTHYSKDHGEGYLTLMEKGYIERLFLPSYSDKTVKPALLSTAMSYGVSVRHLRDGERISASSFSVSVLDARCGEGSNGLVYRLDVPGGKILFTGNLDKNGQRQIVYRGGDVTCDILQVPSHGSRQSYLPEFLAASHPSIGVISTLDSYPPDEEVLKAYSEDNVMLFRTDTQGTVRIRISPDGKRIVETFKQ